jgi:hypothetical protein
MTLVSGSPIAQAAQFWVAGFQAGADFFRSDSVIAGHKDYAGFYFAYGNANVDVNGLVSNAAATAYVLQHTPAISISAPVLPHRPGNQR